MNRVGRVERVTKESKVVVEIDLDGTGQTDIATGVPFFDHMLDSLGKHGAFDLTVHAAGDVELDAHHTVEDTAIVLGQALRQALGDKRGIRRFGDAWIPHGRGARARRRRRLGPALHRAHRRAEVHAPTSSSAATTRRCSTGTCSSRWPSTATSPCTCACWTGRDPHHITEAQFKAIARALRAATERDPRIDGHPLDEGRALSASSRLSSSLSCGGVTRSEAGAASRRRPRSARRAGCRRHAPGAVPCRRIVVLDYGSGNLRSAERALRRVGADVTVTADRHGRAGRRRAGRAGRRRLRGVHGRARGGRGAGIIDRRLAGGRPVLGICVGMQVLFDRGVEWGERTEGCGAVARHRRAAQGATSSRTWAGTPCDAPAGSTLFAGLDADARFYFVHSFAVRRWELEDADACAPPLVTWAHHGEDFVAAVENGALSATQFHPEKSGDAGRDGAAQLAARRRRLVRRPPTSAGSLARPDEAPPGSRDRPGNVSGHRTSGR